MGTADIIVLPRKPSGPASRRTTKMRERLSRGVWLNPAEVRSLAEIRGKHRVGPHVLLVIVRPGKGCFEWRYTLHGRTRALGLGGFPSTPLSEVHTKAERAAALLRQGIDPVAKRHSEARAASSAVTFRQAAEACIAAHAPGWGAKHSSQWVATLRDHAFPALGDLPIDAVDTEAVLRCLSPIWIAKAVTASRTRGRIEQVLDFAKAMGQRTGENPARWRGHLQLLLPAPGKVHVPRHYKALPWQAVPDFMARLRSMESSASVLAVEFAVLTAARSAEVREAVWAEIDMAAGIWTVPAERMKAARLHRVPLSGATLDVLRRAKALDCTSELIFPGAVASRPLSIAALLGVLHRLGHDATVHGFRSAFSTWAAEQTEYPREIVEGALAHVIGNAVERSYSRGDRLDRRRALMADWAAYCAGGDGHVG